MSDDTLSAEDRELREQWDRELAFDARLKGREPVQPVDNLLVDVPKANVGGEVTANEDTAAKKVVLLRLTLRAWGIKRALPKALITVDADKKYIGANKDILDKSTLAEIRALDGSIRAYLGEQAFPSQFKSGVYLVPIRLVNKIDKWLQARLAKRRELIEEFLVEYPKAVEAARIALRAAFNANDYPTVESLRQSFDLSYSYFTFDAPDQLKAISAEIFARETENAKEWWKQAKEEARAGLGLALKGTLDHLITRLSKDAEGERLKGLRETAVSGLQEFLDEFAERNIANDAELQQIATRLREVMKGVDVNALRNNLGIREQVKVGLEDVKEQLDKVVVDKPVRAINLDDDLDE